MTQNALKMALFTAEFKCFLNIKSINVFQLSIPNFALAYKQIQWPIPDVSVNDPMVHFTLKWTFHKIINLEMFFYSENITSYKILKKSNEWFPR